VILNDECDAEKGNAARATDNADLIFCCTLLLANLDLPRCFKFNTGLNAIDRNTFDGGDEQDHTNYPFFNHHE
jgi:2,4-dienoyl-CoA reductase-like NADH-dependent reductase (Old Yellow Enzyme family)